MHNDNGKPFIAILYNVLFDPGLCDKLFSIIALMNLVHTYLFNKGFCTVFFSDNEHNAFILPHITHRKHAFLVKNSQNYKSKLTSKEISGTIAP